MLNLSDFNLKNKIKNQQPKFKSNGQNKNFNLSKSYLNPKTHPKLYKNPFTC